MPPPHPLPLSSLRLTGGLLLERQQTVASATLRTILRNCEQTGRIENFRRAAQRLSGGHQGRYYNDSDVYKWLEACAYAAGRGQLPPDVARASDAVIDAIAAAQEPDGYLNTFFQLQHPEMKWRSLHAMHELYCLGHLFESGVAWSEATGDKRLLAVSCKAADLVDTLFGPAGRTGYPGHPEVELALLRLGGAVGEPRYRACAKAFVDRRGMRPSPYEAEVANPEVTALNPGHAALVQVEGAYSGAYLQDHKPLREHDTIEGHAVRALYLYTAAAELAREDSTLLPALERVWSNLLERRTYITGGVGSSGTNEGFTQDFDLPNREAYAETCASVALAMCARAMLNLDGSSEHADALETALFNGVLAGISTCGERFFYANPLESWGGVERPNWYSCACCPPNIARFLGSVEAYLAGQSEGALWIHIPTAMGIETQFHGVDVRVDVEGNYPWSGEITVTVTPREPVSFALRLRIPDWCEDAELRVDYADEEAVYDRGYAVLDRTWRAADRVHFTLAMPPRWVVSDARVLGNAGRVALCRGPIVYCVEEVDLGAAPQCFLVDPEAPITPLGESNNVSYIISGSLESGPSDALYTHYEPPVWQDETARLVPYHQWANRGPGAMEVWLRTL